MGKTRNVNSTHHKASLIESIRASSPERANACAFSFPFVQHSFRITQVQHSWKQLHTGIQRRRPRERATNPLLLLRPWGLGKHRRLRLQRRGAEGVRTCNRRNRRFSFAQQEEQCRQQLWPYERQRIDRAYPDFSKWVADKNYNIDWTIKWLTKRVDGKRNRQLALSYC